MNIFFLIQNHDRNPESTTTANVCLIGLYNWSLIGLYLVSIWSLGGFYASSDENLKSKHVIGNRVLSVAISIVTPSFPRAPAFYVRWSNDHCSRLAGSDVQITRHGRKHTHEPTARKPGAPPKHFDHGSHLELSEYQLARRMQDVKLRLQPPVPPNGQGRGNPPFPPA